MRLKWSEADEMFSEAELVFLAFVFIVTLGCIMLEGGRFNTTARRPTNKKRQRITKRRHCLDVKNKIKRGPEEHDDEEPYNCRG